MGSNSVNIGWNKYETAILIDAYIQVKDGKLLRKDAVAQVSKRLRERMLGLEQPLARLIAMRMGFPCKCLQLVMQWGMRQMV